MFLSTLPRLRCPKRASKKRGPCGGALKLSEKKNSAGEDLLTGTIQCTVCRADFPVLSGVAVIVDDVESYLFGHHKGISQLADVSELPARYRDDFAEALRAERENAVEEHIEEDLEAERVVSLYFMNHYLRTEGARERWWAPRQGEASPLIDELVRKYWDSGPFSVIRKKMKNPDAAIVELGCGAGGLLTELGLGAKGFYLGVDGSFASIALARHLQLGAPYRRKVKIPEDLIDGPVSRPAPQLNPPTISCGADFVVGDLEAIPLESGAWDVSIALNAIDMLEDPAQLPRAQFNLLKKTGTAVQSCPYIWHERVMKKLRPKLPAGMHESSRLGEWLYKQAGFQIEESHEHVPWLFFKHVRQLEIYSVHLFIAARS